MASVHFPKSFVITHNARVEVAKSQLNTVIVFQSLTKKDDRFILDSSFTMDVDRWTEFKKTMYAIDEEFQKRFNYPYDECDCAV